MANQKISELTAKTRAASSDMIPIVDNDSTATTKRISPDALMPVGTYIKSGRRTAPTGFLACDGSAVSRTTYADLYAALCPTLGTFTVTIASPAVVTLAGHGLQNGDRVRLFTTSALPTNLSANTDYYVKSAATDTFRLAATSGGADINTTGSQSGVHTLQLFQHGAGNGSTTFNLPDARGLVMVGAGTHGTMTRANGTAYNGGSVGATRNDQVQGHYHALGLDSNPNFGRVIGSYMGGGSIVNSTLDAAPDGRAYAGTAKTDTVNGTPRTGDETRPAEIAVLVCIKY